MEMRLKSGWVILQVGSAHCFWWNHQVATLSSGPVSSVTLPHPGSSSTKAVIGMDVAVFSQKTLFIETGDESPWATGGGLAKLWSRDWFLNQPCFSQTTHTSLLPTQFFNKKIKLKKAGQGRYSGGLCLLDICLIKSGRGKFMLTFSYLVSALLPSCSPSEQKQNNKFMIA